MARTIADSGRLSQQQKLKRVTILPPRELRKGPLPEGESESPRNFAGKFWQRQEREQKEEEERQKRADEERSMARKLAEMRSSVTARQQDSRLQGREAADGGMNVCGCDDDAALSASED